MQYFLISFTYDVWNQGHEAMHETLLVQDDEFEWACNRILASGEYSNARDFQNKTLE